MSNQRYEIKAEEFQKLNSRLLYISHSRYQGDWKSIPHTHPFTELFYVVSGRGTFLLDHETYPIGAGDLVIVPPGSEHTEQSLNPSPMEYIVLGIDGITFLGTEQASSQILYHYSKKTELLNLLDLILQEVRTKETGYDLACQHLLDLVIIQMIRQFRLVPAPISSSKMTKECIQIKNYLDSNYSDHITLESLAKKAHMNKYYLVHAFSRYAGESPMQYLNAKRLQIGRELLLSTDYSIAQVASSVGFSSQSYFSQVFRKESGISPMRYRKEGRQENSLTRRQKP